MGVGRNRRIVVAPDLLDGDRPVAAFVLAHELTHLSRHHVAVRSAVAAMSAIGGAAALVAALADGRLWARLGLEVDHPSGLPLAVLVVAAAQMAIMPAVGWLSRAQERRADAGAAASVDVPDPSQLTALYLDGGIDLDPPRLARWLAHHPPPAERLEVLSRHRKELVGPVTGLQQTG
jgi:Zn-dependent protease with chaperone function